MASNQNSKRDQEKKDKRKRTVVYSTKKIQEILDSMNSGYEPDMTPFFENDIDFRDANVPFEMTEWEKEEWLKCSLDPEYFIANYVKFQTDYGYKTVKLREYQKKMVHLMGDEDWNSDLETFVPKSRYNIIMCSRQMGKTTTVCSVFLHYMLFHVERNLFITANKGTTATEIVNKLTEMLKGLPFWLKPGIIKKNQSSLKFDNGCYMLSAAASKTPATSFTIHFMYVDEAALIANNIIDDYWKSVFPTLSSSKVSKIVLTSTPRGRQNLFYRLWEGSQQCKNSFKNLRADWWENPDHDEAWAEQQKADFGEEEFAQEFELQWDVAASKLIRGTDNQFMNRIRKEYVNVDIPSVPKEYCDNFYWHPSFDPNSIDNKWKRFVIIGDTAEGKAIQISGKNTTDYNVLQIFEMQLMPYHRILKNMRDKKIDITDCFRFRQVGVYMDNLTDEETMGSAAKYLVYYVFRSGSKIMGSYLDNTRILIEMNFNGKNFLNKFMDDDHWYEEIVFKTHHTKPVPGKYMKKSFGFKTTTGGKGIGKAYFCENGAKMITDRRVIVSHYNKNENLSTLTQLNAFDKIRKSNNSDYFIYGGVGLHDDLAYSVLNCSRVVEIEEYKEWIEDYFMTGIEKDSNWQKVAMLLRKSVEKDEGSMTDKEFSDMYTGGGVTPYNNFNRQTMNYPTFNQGVLNGQTYGTLMRGGLLSKGGMQNPYLGKGVVNPYLNRNR